MRPCPVCGAEDRYIQIQWMGQSMLWHYICTQCRYDGPGAETPELARIAWEEQDA